MKNSWNIYSRDIKNIVTNWVVAIIIGGLILLPSLYAWLNIKASWDPYGQTDEIPVGVVNEDEGATVRGEKIHVGNDLVETLKDNDSMNWQFVDRKEAMDKVEYGDFYAVIMIPSDFSEQLSTVISDSPQKASMEYFVNEKINAIAPKITEKGASVIVDNISSEFISTVNGVIFDMFNKIGVEIEKDLPDIERFEKYIFTIEKELPEIHDLLDGTLTDANKAGGIISKAQKMVPQAESAANQGLDTINNTLGFLNNAEKRLDQMGPEIRKGLEKAQQISKDINNFIGDILDTSIDFDRVDELADQLNGKVEDSIQTIELVQDALNQLKETTELTPDQEAKVDQALEELATLKGNLEQLQNDAGQLRQVLEEKEGEIKKILTDIQGIAEKTDTRLDEFVKEYTENIEPTVKKEIANAKQTLASAKQILTEVKQTIPEVKSILQRTDGSLKDGKEMIQDVLGEYPYVNEKVNELADKIRKLQEEADIHDIIDLLQNDPEAERGFFSEPVELHENKIFPIENYGTGMTPFYTVLSIWVGALLLISLLSTDVLQPERFTGREMYFGRMLTFLTAGIFQTIIVTSGDILLLGVHVVHPFLFILFGLFCSFIFITIVYTLVSVFGDVGKALAIVLLVFQIAGSGGTYPVVLLPKFFQFINPLLPFTYAIDLMREAVGGIVWERALWDIGFLALFGLIFILIGMFLKEHINKLTNGFKKKSKESGLFH